MDFTLERSIPLLTNTPEVLAALTQSLDQEWLFNNEGGETWCVVDVLGHLIHGEKANWMQRAMIILSKENRPFPSFDRFAQFEESKGKTLQELLAEFKALRMRNVDMLLSLGLTEAHNAMKGMHPAFGEVTLSQLLATWTVHDLDHIMQISRIMAKQYKDAVGPWTAYLKILNQ